MLKGWHFEYGTKVFTYRMYSYSHGNITSYQQHTHNRAFFQSLRYICMRVCVCWLLHQLRIFAAHLMHLENVICGKVRQGCAQQALDTHCRRGYKTLDRWQGHAAKLGVNIKWRVERCVAMESLKLAGLRTLKSNLRHKNWFEQIKKKKKRKERRLWVVAGRSCVWHRYRNLQCSHI